MRVVIITDPDAVALTDKIKLEAWRTDHANFKNPGEELTAEQNHNILYTTLLRWFRCHGLDDR